MKSTKVTEGYIYNVSLHGTPITDKVGALLYLVIIFSFYSTNTD